MYAIALFHLKALIFRGILGKKIFFSMSSLERTTNILGMYFFTVFKFIIYEIILSYQNELFLWKYFCVYLVCLKWRNENSGK